MCLLMHGVFVATLTTLKTRPHMTYNVLVGR